MRLTTTGHADRQSFAMEHLSSGLASAILVLTLILCFELDRISGSAPVQHLYYVPIIFAALRFGTGGALTLAGAATVLYHVANPHLFSFRYEEADIVQIALFVAVGVVSAKLTDDGRRLHQLASTDDLTGLHNLRSFEARFNAMVRIARETKAPLAVLVLDVDELKSLNDVHGHLAGAEAVRMVGHLIAARLPVGAVACRYGGDEFVVALPNYPHLQAIDFARELRSAVNAVAPVLAGIQFPPGRLSVSIGVAYGREATATRDQDRVMDEARGEALFRAADTALYAAKAGGRNRVCVRSADTDLVAPMSREGPVRHIRGGRSVTT